jgi:Spy/CpxP family protein refolding chaperone
MKPNLMKFAVAAVMAAGMAFAQTAPASPGRAAVGAPHTKRAEHQQMMQALNLTPAQKTQAKTIFGNAWQNSKPIFSQLRQNNMALAAAVRDNDSAKIQELASAQGKLRGELVANHESAMAKFYQILTPEQRIKADQMQAQAQARMQRRFERMQQQHEKNASGNPVSGE